MRTERRQRVRSSIGKPAWALAGLLALLPLLVAGAPDPGIVFELDRDAFVVRASDLADGSEGPRLRVAVGSPAHPTPAGTYPVYNVVRSPGWRPGETARRYGARPIPPSTEGPLGVAKIAFARAGIALHGGANPLLIGKPVSLGCVRALDEDVLGLLDWLEDRGALGKTQKQPDGEVHQGFLRRARMVVR
jgi:lipoprotein-anchoring transpeptidase ErfK/SrfK